MFGDHFFNPFDPTLLKYIYEGITGYSALQLLGILLPFLFGLSLFQLFFPKAGYKEKAFIAFPLGMSVFTLVMFFLIVLGVPLTTANLVLCIFLLTLGALTPPFLKKEITFSGFRKRWKKFLDYKSLNFIWILSFAVIFYAVYGVSLKAIFWPTFDTDAVNSFELFAKAISAEGTFINSVVLDESTGKGIPYPPFVPLAITYFFKMGFVKSKLLFALLLSTFVFAFYSVCRKALNRTASALATFFMVLTPEMMAFAALTKTNVVQMVFAALGVMYMYLFLKNRKDEHFYLGSVLLAMNAWTRSEGIEFLFVTGLVLLFYFWKRGLPFKKVLSYSAIAIFPFLVWQIFIQVNHSYFDHVIQVSLIKYPFWDAEKFNIIFQYFKSHMVTTQYYGVGFIVFLMAVFLNLLLYFRKREHVLLVLIFGSILMHFILLYQFNYLGNNMVHLLKHSLKRYYFNFIPLIWFYVFCTPFVQQGLRKYEAFLKKGLEKKEDQKAMAT